MKAIPVRGGTPVKAILLEILYCRLFRWRLSHCRFTIGMVK